MRRGVTRTSNSLAKKASLFSYVTKGILSFHFSTRSHFYAVVAANVGVCSVNDPVGIPIAAVVLDTALVT